jgi:DNA-binding IclR family transcriptional regulator
MWRWCDTCQFRIKSKGVEMPAAKKNRASRAKGTAEKHARTVDKNFIGLTSKVFAVLEALGEGKSDPLSLEDVTRSVRLAKTTVHRLLYSLAKIGYVERNDQTGKYALAGKFFEIGRDALPHRRLIALARPFMKSLATRFGVSAHLGVLEQGQVVYIAVEQSSNPFRCAASVGDSCYCHSTSIGKSILAYLSEEEFLNVIVQHGLPRLTPRTITSRSALNDELERVREGGYATDQGENIEGVICVGAPIFDRGGRVLAAASASAPAGQMERQLETLQREIRRMTGKLSIMLGSAPTSAGAGSGK